MVKQRVTAAALKRPAAAAKVVRARPAATAVGPQAAHECSEVAPIRQPTELPFDVPSERLNETITRASVLECLGSVHCQAHKGPNGEDFLCFI